MRYQFDGNVGDERKALIVIGDQTGKRVLPNDVSGMFRKIELFR
jgi:hypothetical protein